VIAHPPLAPLHILLAPLDAAGIPHALGGSGLLAALGLVNHVNDWDVTVEADVDTLAALHPAHAFTRHGNSGGHADHKLTFAAERTELIARFAFFVPGGIVRIPTVVTGRWNGVPLGSPVAWAAAYAIMAQQESDARRADRAERLFAWLDAQGADAGLEPLLTQPLPPGIGDRLRRLERGRRSDGSPGQGVGAAG
jgi:hypothetical protein